MNRRSQKITVMDNRKAQNSQLAKLSGTPMQAAKSRARRSDSQNIRFRKTNLQDAYLWEADFQDQYLREANFEDAYLWGANLQNTYLLEANFQGAYLGKANFQEAYLWEANLQNAYLRRVNFQGADLWQANFQDAYLGRANFQGAVLTQIDFRGAMLLATDLTGVIDLDISQFEGERAPYLCAVKLPNGVSIDPNRDCSTLPQVLCEKYPFWYETLDDARAYVNRIRHGQHS